MNYWKRCEKMGLRIYLKAPWGAPLSRVNNEKQLKANESNEKQCPKKSLSDHSVILSVKVFLLFFSKYQSDFELYIFGSFRQSNIIKSYISQV